MSVHEIDRAHARLSASGAHRWMHCTASAWAELGFADRSSSFSEEGTRAHTWAGEALEAGIEAAEWITRKLIAIENELGDDADAYETAIDQLETDYPPDMAEYVQGYLDYVRQRIAEAQERNPDAIVYIEQRVDFSPWVPEGFGTGDCVIISDEVLDVTDLKYGKGVFVGVEENVQLMLYALGAWNMFRHLFDLKRVVLNLYQPRINNIAQWEISVEQLLEWAESQVKPTAARVWYAMETGDLSQVEFDATDSEACQFCKAKVHCRERNERMLAMTVYEFREPALLTDDEVIRCLAEAQHLQKWAGDLETWALDQATKGKKFQGKKLVEGRANRKYTDEATIRTVLALEGFRPEQYMKSKLLGITDMTALLKGKKKFDALLGEYIEKPRGKPVLVDETDPRPELDDKAKAADGFDPVQL
jgi:hypothetical protein